MRDHTKKRKLREKEQETERIIIYSERKERINI